MKQKKFLALALLFLCVLAVSACTRSNALTGGSSWPGMTVEDDIVYTANGSFIEAVQNGKELWSYPEEANNRLSFFSAPAVDETHVFAGTYANQLHIINKADGTLAASVEVGNSKNKIIASPVVAEGKVYVASSGGMVSSYTVNVSGEALTPNWQTTLSGEIWVRPVFNEGKLYVATMDKKMNILDAATGTVTDSTAIGAIMDDPVFIDGKLYFSTLSKEVDEMDLSTNTVRTLMTAEAEIWTAPLLVGDKLIAADMDGYIYCIDAASGTTEWKSEKLTAVRTGFIASPIALDENTVLLIDETGQIMTYDLSGKSIGQRSLGQSVYTTPASLPNGSFAVIPVSEDGQIKAFTLDLKEDWVYTRAAAGKKGAGSAAEPAAEATAAETK